MITFSQLGRVGRFGNCLFQIAGTIGIAIKSGQPFAFPKFIVHDMVERFGSKEDPEVWKYLANPLPELPTDINLSFQQLPYEWEYRDIDLPGGNWDLGQNHLQSVKYFAHCMDTIRHYFTFKDEYPQNDYVAIHYRAGDYIDNQNAYHPRCDWEYYNAALSQFSNDQSFLVFSDNPNIAANLIVDCLHDQQVMRIESDSNYIDDFKRMKSCKSFISSNSSYSHMAALLGTHPDKKIIMPRRWFGAQANGLNFDTLYPPEAIIL